MKNGTPISAIMTKNIIALTRDDSLERAEMLFKKYRIRHLPVVSKDIVVGMLSYTDLMRISYSEIGDNDENIDSVVYNSFSIEQVMIKDVVAVNVDTSIKEVAQILASREFHALPVVENSILVGMVTTTDLLKYFIKEL